MGLYALKMLSEICSCYSFGDLFMEQSARAIHAPAWSCFYASHAVYYKKNTMPLGAAYFSGYVLAENMRHSFAGKDIKTDDDRKAGPVR